MYAFRRQHPGGAEVLRALGGRDATAAMRAAPMPPLAFQLMRRFRVGTVSASKDEPARAPPAPRPDTAAPAHAESDLSADCSYGNRLLNLCECRYCDRRANFQH
ncbi:hypothetical protein EVAR_98855_1 [Eumeta japonica]|uniref:Cytochrome b5 heme-binding domain-containing protein n=1 Tax=Eumeta variegata TaxID=151549 RepID=A0A4C1Z747_EUMVA|nr:hypothetical protein EVAR_98855_1 [Eumeta japonica]